MTLRIHEQLLRWSLSFTAKKKEQTTTPYTNISPWFNISCSLKPKTIHKHFENDRQVLA